MATLPHLLFGSAILACAQFSFAQAGDVTTGPKGVATVPPVAMPRANHRAPDHPAPSDAISGGNTSGAMSQSQAATTRSANGAGSQSNDPFVMRREARARALADYRARVQAARRQLREDRRAADALLQQPGASSGQ